MTRLLSEPLTVQTDAAGRPLRFTWRNLHFRVAAIHQHWQVDTDWWDEAGRVYRDYVAVTTQDGLFCVLAYDHLTARWFLSHAYD